MSTPATFNGSRPVIDVNDTTMLLIDHQSGLFQTVGDMPMPELRARAAALAKMASLAGIPVITTASVPQGPNGPLIPEIHENAPHAQYIANPPAILNVFISTYHIPRLLPARTTHWMSPRPVLPLPDG